MKEVEMKRLMGINLPAPDGSFVELHRPDGISDSQFFGMLGNAIPVNLLQRVLAPLLGFANLTPQAVPDIWDCK